jgi:pimeloyl-ACP methyl ester carboxylesterase
MNAKRTLDVQGRGVFLLEGGDGPPLLYLHGLADVHGAVAEWQPFHEMLAESFRLLVPAHPGCAASDGISEVDTVEDLVFHYLDLLDSLGVERASLVGACLGGWIAAELAVRHPERIRRLVLMDAPGLHVPGSPIADLFMLSQRSDWGKHADLRRLLFGDPDSALALGMFPDGRYASISEELLRYQSLTLAARIGWTPPYFYNRKLRGRLRRISVPALIVWGREDRFVPPAHAHAYHEGIRGSELELLDTGHSPWLEAPEACARLVTAFLQKPGA